jgi:Ca-activated chloride channel family protein
MRPASSKFASQVFATLSLVAAPAFSAAAQGIILPRPCPRPSCPTGSPVVRTSSHVVAELRDRVVRYEVTETFVNRGGGIAEADYVFPLPRNAAFRDLALEIGGELVAGETLGADRARGIYEEIVRRQKDPALVEWLGHGMLRARIFPIAPGEEKQVVVRFEAVAEREGASLRIDYARASAPQGGGPIAMPVPEPRPLDDRPRTREERFQEQARRPLAGDLRIEGMESRQSFTLRYEEREPYGAPYSPTHALRVSDRGGRRTIVADGDAPQVTILLPMRRANTAAITLLPHAPGRQDGFALVTIAPPEVRGAAPERDVTFVVDVSGSMAGRKMEQARAAGHQFLATLSPRDRFRLVEFATEVNTFRDEFVPATREHLRAAARWIDALEARGSTNISGALEEALAVRADRERVPLVLFVTDGEPTVGLRDAGAIAGLAARLRGRARVFTFGVGADVNAQLMEQLALDGNGTAQFVRPGESVERAVSLVAQRLTVPTVMDVRMRVEGGNVRLEHLHPRLPADIFAGQDLVLLARYDGDGEARLVVEGRTVNGPVTWTERVRFPERERGNAFVARLWAAQRIGWLAAEKRRNGGSRELDAEIRELGMTYGIPTEFSSYLVLEPGMQVGNVAGGRGSAMPQSAPAMNQVVTTGAAAAPEAARERRFEAARDAAAQRSATSIAAVDSLAKASAERAGGDVTRRVGARTFVQANGVWTDTRPIGSRRTVRVQPWSPAYFALLEKLGELREVFALGDRMRVVGERVVIELAPDGVESLSTVELARLTTDW